ncbi:single-strand DNA endonuclease 1 isoform X3 [Quercus suber]|uniref:single-strand DNA endonuclease 1 isoform X3 n=1 Tax=Quercus suber TaxID=58331 RepID=UPI0032DF9768
MVQLHNVSKSHSCMKEKVYLRGLFHRLRALIAVNCTIVFVTDRSIPAIKLSTYRRRLNSRSEDGCYTLDSDVFLFGERTVYGICLDVERRLGFGRNSLITLALLLGCDYSQGVHGLGPETMLSFKKLPLKDCPS